MSDKKGTFWKVSIFSSLSILKAPRVQTLLAVGGERHFLSSASCYTAAVAPLQHFNLAREERNATIEERNATI